MPELPDVETLARRLRRRLRGRRIRGVRLLTPSTVRHPDPVTFTRLLPGRRVLDVDRRGKYLLIRLSGDLTLAVHLRMTGDFEVTAATTPIHPHTRVLFEVNGFHLRFIDLRRFGHMDLVTPRQLEHLRGVATLGVEPLGPEFTPARFRQLVRGHRMGLKVLLLRQDLIAGIGNLYADEILWQARLHPGRSVDTLSAQQIAALYRIIRRVLDRAVRLLPRYGGAVGVFLDARERGGRCPRDHGTLRVARIAGRTTYFCPRCQR
ncbi:MAG: bifunctional DNA-formamidopyrimidine glycosylase/DNA-(apurinic or apyrimidinic site) lyase [Armatimonadota bacterium]|nr:bifunctional DNA-formamidopyrimidine glycosylase/DNA-(apurinic or apyrimidinic site) lyase [Armatimonadota bacterium]